MKKTPIQNKFSSNEFSPPGHNTYFSEIMPFSNRSSF